MGDECVGDGVFRHKSDGRGEGVGDASIVVGVRRRGRASRNKISISYRELVEYAGVFVVDMLSMKAIELRKHYATHASPLIGSIGDLGVGKANTSRRALLGLLA